MENNTIAPDSPLFDKQNLDISNASHKTKIRHHNQFSKTLMDMTLPAKRVMYLMMAQYDSKKPWGNDYKFRVTAADYAELCRIDITNAYRQLKDASEDLMTMVLKVPKNELLPIIPRDASDLITSPDKLMTTRLFHLTNYIDYADGAGFIEVYPSRQLEPYIANLVKVRYTSQTLFSGLLLSDKNSSNFYNFIRECYCQKGTVEFIDITIDDLKERLGLYKIKNREKVYLYEKYKDFNRDVIARSLKVINQNTEMEVSCKVIKKLGRKVHTLRFSYFEKAEHQLSLNF